MKQRENLCCTGHHTWLWRSTRPLKVNVVRTAERLVMLPGERPSADAVVGKCLVRRPSSRSQLGTKKGQQGLADLPCCTGEYRVFLSAKGALQSL